MSPTQQRVYEQPKEYKNGYDAYFLGEERNKTKGIEWLRGWDRAGDDDAASETARYI